MTAVLIVSAYLVALTFFLGLDILSKVPPTLHALVLAALGMLTAMSAVGAFADTARATSSTGRSLGMVALVLAGASAGGGFVAFGRLLRAFRRKSRNS